MSFAHLHTHTAYSLLDGEGTIPNLIDKAAELGQTAMAITDHGNMYGVIDFYEYAKKRGIKPILGCEVYVASRTRHDKTHEKDSKSSHLILLAENNIGYKNLMNIVSIGYTEGFYYKPRIDMEVLRANHDGIIALSACMFGVLSRNILNGNYDEAKRRALEFIDIFGHDNYFIEIQDHGIFEQKKLNRDLINLARELDLQVVATNDIHYVNKSDAEYQDILMCIQMGKTVNDDDRMKMSTSELYVKSEEEMKELFLYLPEALENTQKIADRCNVEIEFGKLHLPEFKLPVGEDDAFEYLKKLTYTGFEKRYNNTEKDIISRLDYELNTIKAMGYVDYFLIVWDFINYAKNHDIRVGPGRGSAAGSVVSYCLGITNVDPVRYGLIFERFLNPERVSMPDIDIDFCYERRGEVIDYVNRKYGNDHVAQIITFGTMKARLAVRDVGRALDYPYSLADSIAKQIPNELKMTIERALIVNHKLKEMYDSDERIKKIIDTARQIEGLPRHASTHAAGVVITREPVKNYVPLQKNDDVITTQFTMTTIERLGLLKMDFLGLRTLTVIRDAADYIYDNYNIKIDIENLDLTDSETYNMISNGETDGVFQLESPGMRRFMKELVPTALEDIIAGISLYRPGPMESIPRYVEYKKNPDKVTYKHPMLEKILDVTYGCIVYQEQVMQIVRDMAGYSLGRADLVRRAMSKKKAEVMEEERKNFIYGLDDGETHIDGAIRRGVDENVAKSVFDEMIDFASYAFNKSHAAAYAVLAYQTAWLKCHYPVEFFAALLSSFIDSSTQVTKYMSVAKRLGITVLPPDVNKSNRAFTVDGDAIRFGLAAVKNVGGAVVEEIEKERNLNGKFKSFTDFCTRMSARGINKRVVESLIKAGAFSGIGKKRSVLLSVFEQVLDTEQTKKKSVMPGQIDMFSGIINDFDPIADDFPDMEELSHRDILAMEREYIGSYVSGHPMDRYSKEAEKVATAQILDILENDDNKFHSGDRIRIVGSVSKCRTQMTKRGELMMYATVEDISGGIEVLIFPSKLREAENVIIRDKIIVCDGTLDLPEEEPPKLRLDFAADISAYTSNKPTQKLYLRIDDTAQTSSITDILDNKEDTGELTSVFIHNAKTKQTYKISNDVKIQDRGLKIKQLNHLLGNDNVKIVKK